MTARDSATLKIALGAYSSAGVKSENQDFHGAMVPEGSVLALKGIAVAVADGIGSSAVSREAAETAVKSLLTDYYCTSDSWTVKTSAARVIEATNAWLHAQNRRARPEDMDRGRVCTLSALVFKGRSAHLFHVGDSRISRLVGQSLERLTEDHVVELSSAERYLGRALGAEPHVELDYRRVPLAVGDVYLLTTDGVHEHLDPSEAARLLAESTNLDATARALADRALENGSTDNLTVQIVRVETLPAAEADEAIEGAAPLPVLAPPEPGRTLDGFRILRNLYANSRSHLMLAETERGERVVLKFPSTDVRQDPEHLRRFAMEEWVARRLTTPHVMKAGPRSTQRSQLYASFEYLDGVTLRQWMRDHPSPDLNEVRDLIEQIAAGVRAFHRQEMRHQDLRPENILINRDGVAKIIDFGSAHIAGLAEAWGREAHADHLGTVQYTAPDYWSGDAVDWRADLYSLGTIAYELLSGQLPYGSQAARVRSRKDALRLSYRSLRELNDQVPAFVDDAIRRAVHPDPNHRQEALSEFTSALRAPGPGYRAQTRKPLAERDPVRFWQAISALLTLSLLVSLFDPFG